MRLAFLFAGQGAQAVGMGRDLYEASPAARDIFDRADAALGRPLRQLCFEGPAEELTLSANCQPAIYTMSVASLKAFLERCPTAVPVACAGLSLGEFAAAVAAGALPFEAGLRLVAERGRLMGEACRASQGTMAAVLNAEPALVDEVCRGVGIDVANYNCPGQIVISGPKAGVEAAVKQLAERGVSRTVALTVDGAFHSRLMQPAAERLAPILDQVPLATPTIPLAQNVVGSLVSDAAAVRANLKAQVTGSVRWEQCVGAVLGLGVEAVVEFGPGKVLAGFMKRINRAMPTYSAGTVADAAEAVAKCGG